MSKSKGYYLSKQGTYVINKQVEGVRIYQRTQFTVGDEHKVKALLAEAVAKIYKAQVESKRPEVTFKECAIEYIKRNKESKQIANFTGILKRLDPYVGHVPAHLLHDEHFAVKRLRSDLKKKGRKQRTIGCYIEAIQRVLNAATNWRYDWCSLTWLDVAPRFKIPKRSDASSHPVLSWEQQTAFLSCCDSDLQRKILFFINTGLRDTELHRLKWSDELSLPGGVMGFVASNKSDQSGNARQKLIVCNQIAATVINELRGMHSEYVFTYKGRKTLRTNNSAFKSARDRAGFHVTVHGLRHTFGHRLREAGVDEETRKELLGHGVSLTTHYSVSSIEKYYEAVQKIVKPSTSTVVVSLDRYRKLW